MKCDLDCFNCQFKDCVNGKLPTSEKNKRRNRDYYRTHLEYFKNYNKEYAQRPDVRERKREYMREYYLRRKMEKAKGETT